MTKITLSQTDNIHGGLNASGTLSVISVLPEDADDKTYTWSSGEPSFVTIDQNGNWKIVSSSGNTYLRATANDGSG